MAGMKDIPSNVPVKSFRSYADWEAWLAKNHAASQGLWLKLAKKGSGRKSVTYDEAVETALCYGWIDGQKKPFDDAFWLQKFTRRGPKSIWAKRNREKAEKLIANGRMAAAGQNAVDAARRDGRWAAAYDSPRSAEVPPDLQKELDHNPTAKAFFASIDSANRYAILFRIHTAKKETTRRAHPTVRTHVGRR